MHFMSFQERLNFHVANFFWGCVGFLLLVLALFFFSAFMLSLAVLLLVGLLLAIPVICLLLPIFFVYVAVNLAIDRMRN